MKDVPVFVSICILDLGNVLSLLGYVLRTSKCLDASRHEEHYESVLGKKLFILYILSSEVNFPQSCSFPNQMGITALTLLIGF